MEIRKLTDKVSVTPQITADDMAAIKAVGFRAIICNRPDGEGADQPSVEEIEAAARAAGIEVRYVPVQTGMVRDEDVAAFGKALDELQRPLLAYCRSGTRSATLWSFHEAKKRPMSEILVATQAAGYDMNGLARRIANGGKTPTDTGDAKYDVVIVGAGAGGISVAASLKSRKPGLSIVVIDPADIHYYQPGWTMFGGGIFEPQNDAVILDGCRVVKYDRLVVCPGLKLDWGKVDGLEETLGRNGVTSNYRYDLAPYTWQLVQEMKQGRALFTQPPMPIKCAGAPQKALYLSGDAWLRRGVLKNIDIQFMNAGRSLRRKGLCARADAVR